MQVAALRRDSLAESEVIDLLQVLCTVDTGLASADVTVVGVQW